MAGSAGIEYTYRYPFNSQLVEASGASNLFLATSQSDGVFPYFFEGRILRPRLTAQLLTALAKVVSTRFYIPPNLLKKLMAERDPIVTAGAGILRFEGFSACCSTYARVDLTPGAYDGEVVQQGTTNVDFNSLMRAALLRVRDGDRLTLSVGPDEVALALGFEHIVERKVELPYRWLRSLVEVQSYQSKMNLHFTADKPELVRFLRSLPKSTPAKSRFFVVRAAKNLRLSQNDVPEAVPITGLQRLQLLTDLAPLADSLSVFCDQSRQTSEWHLNCGPLSMIITMSAEISRGFSGEGQVLTDLDECATERLALLRAALKWESLINTSDLAKRTGLSEEHVRKLLAVLGSRGLVGYDVGHGAYFHRELPFDFELIEEMHPRLRNARNLLSEGKVKVVARSDEIIEIEVEGSGFQHIVRFRGKESSCTCPWYAKYQGEARGPCKHILAARLAAFGSEKSE